MKILLVAPSYYPQVNTSYFPLGLAYVGAYAKGKGHQVDGLNLNHYPNHERYDLLVREIKKNNYDAVGITGLTVCFNEIEKLIKLIRETVPWMPIILGGGITSCEAELVMLTLKPDYMVIGEGEIIFANLLQAIAGTNPIDKLAGIWHWAGGNPIYNGKGPVVADLNTLPEPDLDLMEIKKYLALQGEAQISYHLVRYDMGKSIPMLASRSCPFQCTFCHHAGMGKYKTHDINMVVSRIERYIKEYGISNVSIYDELFSADKRRLRYFCEILLEKKLNIRWFCQLRVDQLDQESLFLMKRAGCNFISLGFESGSDTILRSMQKKIKVIDIANAVKMLRKAKIGFQANFLFGDPAETNETLQESLRFQQENELYFVDWSAVIPYAGTQIFDYAWRKGLIKDKLQFIRNQCDISDYLYRHQINMTSMSDVEFKDWYIKLREINDLNHRKRSALVQGVVSSGKWQSRLAIECPSCGYLLKTDFRYPLEAREDGNIYLDAPIGMLGVNFLCPNCCRKMHLQPKHIPHFRTFFKRFQEKAEQIKLAKRDVVIIPAMDRYFSVFKEDILLNNLRIKAVLDSRKSRVGEKFLNRTVKLLDNNNIKKNKDAVFIVLPWVEYGKAVDALIDAGIDSQMILSWNQSFEPAGQRDNLAK